MSARNAVVCAAGVVPFRHVEGTVQVLLVGRPPGRHRGGDWSFPKGSVRSGESWRDAAVREAFEETGLRVAAGVLLTEVSYRRASRGAKTVRYFVGEVSADLEACPDGSEVTELCWTSVPSARRMLTWDRDRTVLDVFMDLVTAGQLRPHVAAGPAGADVVPDVSGSVSGPWLRQVRDVP